MGSSLLFWITGWLNGAENGRINVRGLNNCGCKRVAKDRQRVFPSLLCLLWLCMGFRRWQHMILNFPGRWIWRAVPKWGSRTSSPSTDSASLTPLWATSSPMSTSSAPRADTFGTSGLTPGTSVLGFELLNSPTAPNSFSSKSLTGGPGLLSLVLGPFKRLPSSWNPSTACPRVPTSARRILHFAHAAGYVLEPLWWPFSQRPHKHTTLAVWRARFYRRPQCYLCQSLLKPQAGACGPWPLEMSLGLRCRHHRVISVRILTVNSQLSPLQFFYFVNSTNTSITKVLVLDLQVLREVDLVLVWTVHILQEYALFPMLGTQFDNSLHEFDFRHDPFCTHVSGFRILRPRAVPFQNDPDLTVIRLLARHAFLCQPGDGLHCACKNWLYTTKQIFCIGVMSLS